MSTARKIGAHTAARNAEVDEIKAILAGNETVQATMEALSKWALDVKAGGNQAKEIWCRIWMASSVWSLAAKYTQRGYVERWIAIVNNDVKAKAKSTSQ